MGPNRSGDCLFSVQHGRLFSEPARGCGAAESGETRGGNVESIAILARIHLCMCTGGIRPASLFPAGPLSPAMMRDGAWEKAATEIEECGGDGTPRSPSRTIQRASRVRSQSPTRREWTTSSYSTRLQRQCLRSWWTLLNQKWQISFEDEVLARSRELSAFNRECGRRYPSHWARAAGQSTSGR